MSYDSNSSLDRALELAKKRAAELSRHNGDSASPAKRHFGGGPDLYLKLLIPGFTAGHIIGRGGETIAELRKNSGGAYIKTSKKDEYFPGTRDWVGLISGPQSAIGDMVQALVKLMQARMEELGERDSDRYRSIKIVVPESTMGMVIGKGGEAIAEMRQRSGSNILTQKKGPEEKLTERIVTLIGERRSNAVALDMILDKIAEDPNSGSCQEINYGEAGATATGYGYSAQRSFGSSSGGSAAAVAAAPGYDTINVNGHTHLRLTLNMMTPIPPDPWVSSQAMPHINYSLRQAGHSDGVADELTRALGLLAAHGVLVLTQSAAVGGWAGETAAADTYSNSAYGYGGATPAQPAPPGGHKPMPVREKTPPGEPSGHLEEEVQVEDRMVGAVLGPGGQHLTEIRQYSSVDVQITKRGIYAPGTNNRVITIKGSRRGVQCAVQLVQQKIQEKREKDLEYDRKRGGS